MKKSFVILLTGAAAAALLLGGCTSNPEDSIFDTTNYTPVVFEPLEESSYEEEFHPEDWIEYDEEGEPILPEGVEKSDVFDDAGNFIGDPSMFGYVSGGSQNRTGGQAGGQSAGDPYATGDNGAGVFVDNGSGEAVYQEGQPSEGDWSESYDGEDDGEWEEDSGDDGDDDDWVEDSDDSDDDDEDDGVELWNGTGEWNGY